MARIGRLAGAILAQTQGEYYLIGNLKEPCDFARAGFESPGEIDAQSAPYRRLELRGESVASVGERYLVTELEGEELARCLAQRFVIQRNGSISERLWRLVTDGGGEGPQTPTRSASEGPQIDARWLTEMPSAIWQIVQDAVLRCS